MGVGAAEVDASERGVVAFAAGLEGFELVLGLELHAVEVRFVFHDLVEVLGRRKDAALLVLGDCLGGNGGKGSFGECASAVGLGDLEVFLCSFHIGSDDGDFEAGDAAATPH